MILAVVEAQTKQSEIPARIPGMFDAVYAWLPGSGLTQAGQNNVVYDRFSQGGMRMQVGFPVSGRFAGNEQVRCVEFSGGRAAHATHVGPYSGIGATTGALNAWCAQKRLPLAGMSWEVYGDWTADESLLVTDIYNRLA